MDIDLNFLFDYFEICDLLKKYIYILGEIEIKIIWRYASWADVDNCYSNE
jgi:hypothetical protein